MSVNIAKETTQLCFGVLLVIGNSLVLVAIKKSKSLHKVTYYLLANLSIADILIGLCTGGHAVVQLLEIDGTCLVTYVGVLAGAIAGMAIILMCMQSFLCLAFPTRFMNGLNSRAAVVALIGSWIFSLLQSGSSYLYLNREDCMIFSINNNKAWMRSIATLRLLQMLIMVTLQISSLVLLHRQKRRLRPKNGGGGGGAGSSSSKSVDTARKIKKLEKKSHAVYLIASVLVLYVICYGPFLVMWCLFAFCSGELCDRLEVSSVPRYLALLVIINCVGNIVLFWKKCEEFRTGLSNVLKCGQRVGVGENIEMR